MNRGLFFIAILCWCQFVSAQNPELKKPYDKYDTLLIPYADLGFSTAPMRLKYPFNTEIDKLILRNNSTVVLGLGFAYKWFNLRLGLNLPGNLRPSNKFGPTDYYDLGFDFTLKQFFFDIDLHVYNGFTYKNAYRWNDTLDAKWNPNLHNPKLSSASFSINTWHFWNKDFKLGAFRGKTAAYNQDVSSFYLKYNMSLYGIAAPNGLIPRELIDTNQTRTEAQNMVAFDVGLIPGYGYVRRYKQFQIGAMAGLGAVIQVKSYTTPEITRGFLGLAFRYDVRFVAGLNQPHYFLMLVTEFDNKSIAFNELKYRQTYYTLKLAGGYRFHTKKNRKRA